MALQDLQQAYDVLGCQGVTLKPVRGGASPGEGVLRYDHLWPKIATSWSSMKSVSGGACLESLRWDHS